MTDQEPGRHPVRRVFEWETVTYTVWMEDHWERRILPIVEHDPETGKPVGYRVGQFYAATWAVGGQWLAEVNRLLSQLAEKQRAELMNAAAPRESED